MYPADNGCVYQVMTQRIVVAGDSVAATAGVLGPSNSVV